MSLRLLEQDIDDKNKLIEKLNKCDSSQKLEIKKLSKANDKMRRDWSNYKDSNVDTQQKCNCAIPCVPSDLADLKGHVASGAKSLLAAVSENGDDTGSVPVTNRRQNPTVVRASNTVSSQAPTERISSPLPVRANKAVPPARGRSSAPVLPVVRGRHPRPQPRRRHHINPRQQPLSYESEFLTFFQITISLMWCYSAPEMTSIMDIRLPKLCNNWTHSFTTLKVFVPLRTSLWINSLAEVIAINCSKLLTLWISICQICLKRRTAECFPQMLAPNHIVIILKTKYILITKVNNFVPRKCSKY